MEQEKSQKSSLRWKQYICHIIFGVFAAIALCLKLSATRVDTDSKSALNLFLLKISKSLSGKEVVVSILAILLPMLFIKIEEFCNGEKIILARLWAAILSFCQVIGLSYYYTAGSGLVIDGYYQIFKSIVMLIGFYGIYYYVVRAIYTLTKKKQTKTGTLSEFLFEKKPFLKGFICAIAVRIPIIIVNFPAQLTYDTYWELDMYQNGWMNDHHTLFHTLLINWFGDLGKAMGNQGAGFLINIVLQVLIIGSIIGYAFSVSKKIGTPMWSRYLMFICFNISPYAYGFSASFEKDVLYSYFLFLFIIQLTLIGIDYKAFFDSKKDLIIAIVSATFVCLFRKNGIYVIIGTAAISVIFFIIKGIVTKKFNFSIVAKSGAILLIPVIVLTSFNFAFEKKYNITAGDIKEALSAPFMQTARYISTYDEVTDYEKEVINSVLDYEEIKRQYSVKTNTKVLPVAGIYKDNTVWADLIKNTYKGDDSKLKEYFPVWFKMFLKHPVCYIEATWATNYRLSSYDNVFEYTVKYNPTEGYKDSDKLLDYKQPSWSKNASQTVNQVLDVIAKMPIINLLNNFTTYTILTAIMLLYIINDKKNKQYKRCNVILPLIPVLLSIAICVLGPCLLARYLFPVTYSIPLILGAYSSKKANEEEKSESI